MLSRARLAKGRRSDASGAYPGSHGPMTAGAYSELEVRSEKIGWKGTLDLLVISPDECEITDFKTGLPREEHRFQIEVYALLWTLDKKRNPQGRLRQSAGSGV